MVHVRQCQIEDVITLFHIIIIIAYVPCPLFENSEILQQPADFLKLTSAYVNAATSFIKTKTGEYTLEHNVSHFRSSNCLLHSAAGSPFFLYFPFQHTHQPQFAGKDFTGATLRGPFGDALAELDWGVGQVMQTLKDAGVDNNTFVFFTSDNG